MICFVQGCLSGSSQTCIALQDQIFCRVRYFEPMILGAAGGLSGSRTILGSKDFSMNVTPVCLVLCDFLT